MSTYNKPIHLERTLNSIAAQSPPFDYECIVVDDAARHASVAEVCAKFANVTYVPIFRDPGYANPSAARNVGYKCARGDIIIAQSDDVEHITPNTIERLVVDLQPNTFLIATVLNKYLDGKACHRPMPVFTSPEIKRPFFFLGSLFRHNLYAVGGCDGDFTSPAFDDDWFGDCLVHGQKLLPVFSRDIVGHHLDHSRPSDLVQSAAISEKLYHKKVNEARQTGCWQSSGGPWCFPEPKTVTDWWEECHRCSIHKYLSGSSPQVTLQQHNITVKPGQVVLDFGVGLGYMSKYLHELGVTVHALDISKTGLARVEPYTACRWTPDDTMPSNTYDAAVCHLVAQHVSDEDLEKELRNVLSAMKIDGILSVQFANSPFLDHSVASQMHGGVCREPGAARDLIARAGGRVIWQSEFQRFTHTPTYWYYMHIVRV
jgi:SAM-dependent methyltransferase